MSGDPTVIFVNNVRAVFPKFFKEQAEPYKGKGDPYYSGSFLFGKDHPDLPKVEAAIRAAAQKKFRDKAESTLAVCKAKDKLPIHDGALKADKPYGAAYKGLLYLSARRNARTNPAPIVVDNVVDPATGHARIITGPNDSRAPYSGCYVNVKLSFFGYNNDGEGIAADVVGVQFHRDGERLSGGVVAAADDFEAIPEAVAEKATATGAAALF